MEQRTGGGDYSLPVSGSKRSLGLSTFRLSPDGTLNNVAFAAGLGPLAVGGRLTFDIDFTPSAALVETTGMITLPPGFSHSDIRAVLIGAVAPRGEASSAPRSSGSFRERSAPISGPSPFRRKERLSYFVTATARNSKGEHQLIQVQGLPEIPMRQDLTFARSAPSPIARSSRPPPLKREAVVSETTPHLVWAPPDAGPVDFYRVVLETDSTARAALGGVGSGQPDRNHPSGFPGGRRRTNSTPLWTGGRSCGECMRSRRGALVPGVHFPSACAAACIRRERRFALYYKEATMIRFLMEDATLFSFLLFGREASSSADVSIGEPDRDNLFNQNRPPVANAGPDQTVASGAQVQLEGRGSDPDGNEVRYEWQMVQTPDGSSAQLDTPASQRSVLSPIPMGSTGSHFRSLKKSIRIFRKEPRSRIPVRPASRTR
ncbi:MAG: hypothetical protein MPW14_20345 [Candidatus Manganitrophus sp.]|nr:MAG: hypothetical protein MPW14_20345 [Candidatus Manganitrophus sp.]